MIIRLVGSITYCTVYNGRNTFIRRIGRRFAIGTHEVTVAHFRAFRSNHALYMLMTSLAWTLKAWSALLLPVSSRHRSKHEAERTRLLTLGFRTFLDLMMHVPCQIIRHARRTVYRLLNWTDLTPAFFRLCDGLQI